MKTGNCLKMGLEKEGKIIKTPTERSLQIVLGVSERKPNQRS